MTLRGLVTATFCGGNLVYLNEERQTMVSGEGVRL
jgi:hypothetical protein